MDWVRVNLDRLGMTYVASYSVKNDILTVSSLRMGRKSRRLCEQPGNIEALALALLEEMVVEVEAGRRTSL